jgi:hypothetical protein
VADAVLREREGGMALKNQAVLFRASHHSAALELELSRAAVLRAPLGGIACAIARCGLGRSRAAASSDQLTVGIVDQSITSPRAFQPVNARCVPTLASSARSSSAHMKGRLLAQRLRNGYDCAGLENRTIDSAGEKCSDNYPLAVPLSETLYGAAT